MDQKWIGAVFIIAGCGGFGTVLVSHYRTTENYLQQLRNIIDYMYSDLQYRLTPLPELCHKAAQMCCGELKKAFFDMERELDWQTEPDAAGCMRAVLEREKTMPKNLRKIMMDLGRILGCFDLSGQLRGLQEIHKLCENEIAAYEKNRDIRLRNYRTLTICAGAALIILFA